MSVKNAESNMWSVVENQGLGTVVGHTAQQQGQNDVPFLNRGLGKFALGAGAAVAGGVVTYLYCRSQFGQPKP
jgi:hypothetical protein